MEKFELWMGYFPGCIVVCNKAARENNDYKEVARISYAGNIKYYVQKWYIPADALQKIEETAKGERAKFDEWLDREIKYRPGYIYEKMLDALTAWELLEHLDAKVKGLRECIDRLRPLYTAKS